MAAQRPGSQAAFGPAAPLAAKANGLSPEKYIKYILADMPGSAFLEYPEYLDDYLPWDPYIKEICT